MHFDGPDQFHGFEKRVYGDCNLFLTEETNGRYFSTCGQNKYAVQVSGAGKAGYEAFDRNVTQKACEFLSERKDERPLCMVVGYVLPHNPLIIDQELYDYYYEKLTEENMPSQEVPKDLHPALEQWRKNRGVDDISPEHARRALAAYYGLVEAMDMNIGKVIQSVKGGQNSENTVIIYCSDHGDCAGEHGLWWKSNYYEGSARVPLIISCPSAFEKGKHAKEVSSLIDLTETLTDLAGAEKLPYSEGRSLRSFLEKGASFDDWKNEAYSEYSGAYGEKPSCMIRSGKWKLMYYSEFDSSLLFDMEDDPGELNDLAGESEYAELVCELEAKIKSRWNSDMVAQGDARDLAHRPFIGKCGREFNPCEIVYDKAVETDNSFDKTQIPDWEKIYTEAENNAK
jgi:choline-sulfatase